MGITLEGTTCAEVWEKAVEHLIKYGRYVPSIRGPVIECANVTLVVTKPWDEPRISSLSPLFNQAEEFGTSIRNHPRIINWDGINQLDQIINVLKTDPLSRRAVINIWDPRQDLRVENSQGVVAFIVSIRSDALHLTSILRTTDAWMSNWTLAGIPELQQAIYNKLREDGDEVFRNLSLGTYTQIHASFHIYLDELKNARKKLLSINVQKRD